MHWQRQAGVALMSAGVLLIAGFVVPTVYGRAMASLAVAEFRSRSASNSLWDSARIRAYKQTLGVTMAAPEALLRVPKAGIEVPVFEGTSDLVLNRGAGHVSGTAMPGEPGNMAITGHRDGFFRGLKDLAIGDRIEVQSNAETGRTDIYVIDRIRIVLPQDVSVLKPAESSKGRSMLTLITCYPFYYIGAAPERYIVQASLLRTPNGGADHAGVNSFTSTSSAHLRSLKSGRS